MADNVNHPVHYNRHPSGVECITIIQHFCYNIGAAIKYLWRANYKGPDPTEDLEKAIKYIEFEIARLNEMGQASILEGRETT